MKNSPLYGISTHYRAVGSNFKVVRLFGTDSYIIYIAWKAHLACVARGIWACPPRKFLKTDVLRLHLRVFLSTFAYIISYVAFKLSPYLVKYIAFPLHAYALRCHRAF